jgi:hypothetical protein
VYSGKFILAAMHLRRVGIDGSSYAAATMQVLTDFSPQSKEQNPQQAEQGRAQMQQCV